MIYNLLNNKQNGFGKKLIMALLLLLVAGSMNVFAQSIDKPHDFKSGDIISATEMNENFDVLYAKVKELMAELEKKEQRFGYAPVGSIVAWHKDFSENYTPELPEGWVLCDGESVNDRESPYFNIPVPNLNGEGRFLRGSGKSGTTQEATSIGNYIHNSYLNYINNHDGIDISANLNENVASASGSKMNIPLYKVRPVNMSVVWIIRVK